MKRRIRLMRSEVMRCTGCHRRFRFPMGALDGDMDGPCDCGSTSVDQIREGRPFGARSRVWRLECEVLGVDPKTGEAPDWLWRSFREHFVWEAATGAEKACGRIVAILEGEVHP